MKLKETLSSFKGATNEKELQLRFQELAPAFLYSGFIQIRNDYKVYIRTVEFYFHSEMPDGIHDPIVYHRNARDCDGNILTKVPYFPIMTLHAHNSGFDITFESETDGGYRASALIRSYEIKDNEGNYLKWDKDKCIFVKSLEYCFNTQSTYLYFLLNGFSLDNSNDIIWKDQVLKQSLPMLQKTRQNVFQSKCEFVYKKKEDRCDRLWSFTREEQV